MVTTLLATTYRFDDRGNVRAKEVITGSTRAGAKAGEQVPAGGGEPATTLG